MTQEFIRKHRNIIFYMVLCAVISTSCSSYSYREERSTAEKSAQVNPPWLQRLVEANPEPKKYIPEMGSTPDKGVRQEKLERNKINRLKNPLSSLPDLTALISSLAPDDLPEYKGSSTVPVNAVGAAPNPELEAADSDLATMKPAPKGTSIVINNNSELAKKTKVPLPPKIVALSYIEKIYNSMSGFSSGKELLQFGYDIFSPKTGTDKIVESEEEATKAGLTEAQDQDYSLKSVDVGMVEQPKIQDFLKDAKLNLAGPVDPDYLIGIGDEIVINIAGSLDLSKKFTVDRNGEIFLPEVGALSLVGVRFSKLEETITKHLSSHYQNIQVEVSLGKIQSIRVVLAGRLKNPGLTMIPANSTLIDALSIAQPTKDGTLRQIRLLRKGQKEKNIDLYSVLLGKGQAENITLLAGDTIYVGPIGKTVTVVLPEGGHIFEILEGQELKEVIGYCGESAAFFRNNNFQVERTYEEGERKVFDYTLKDEAQKLYANDGDVVKIFEIYAEVNNVVELSGSVVKSGSYPYTEGMTISQLLKKGEGFLIDASLNKALLTRRLGRTHRFDITPGDKRGVTAEETIWVDLTEILSGNKEADIQLNRLDRLKVLSKSEAQDAPTISIIGAIRKPGVYRLSGGLTLEALVDLAGGPTGDAYQGTSMIVRRRINENGKHFDAEVLPFNLSLLLNGSETPIRLENHDHVVIRKVQSLQVKVKIGGRVQFPGTYILPDGSRISDLLIAAGGLLDKADLRAAVFSRESIRTIQQRRLEDLFMNSEEHFSRNRNYITRDGRVTEAVASHLDLLGLSRLSENMRQFQAQGRVVLDLMRDDFVDSQDDLVLEEQDVLYIPRRMNSVVILGRVFYPNAFVWRDGMTVDDYINKAGGMKDDADKSQTYLVMASGEVRSAAQEKYGNSFYSYNPGPGDTLLIPSRPLARSKLHFISDTVSLVKQMAEVGLIGASIPRVNDSEAGFATGLDLGTAPQPIPTSIGKPYDEMLLREKALRVK